MSACRSTEVYMEPIRRERKSPFIQPFKPPQGHGICPGFYKLTPGIGCPYSCSYCYLDKTLRSMEPGKGNPRRYEVYTNVEKMMLEITKFIAKPPQSCSILNMGETLDSLATPELKNSVNMVVRHFEQAWGFFKEFDVLRHLLPTLLLLTKSTNIPDCDPPPNVVLSWSINAPIAARIEKGAPHPARRFRAALKAKAAGWRVRVRIDPILAETDDGQLVPHHDYKTVFEWMGELKPERITLGVLRKSGKPVNGAGWRIPTYRLFINAMRGICEVGLCKETPEVYAALGLSTEDIKCNCTP